MSDWRPIETAPKDGTRILAAWSDWRSVDIVRWCGCHDTDDGKPGWVLQRGRFRLGSVGADPEPSFWMPLPEKPED